MSYSRECLSLSRGTFFPTFLILLFPNSRSHKSLLLLFSMRNTMMPSASVHTSLSACTRTDVGHIPEMARWGRGQMHSSLSGWYLQLACHSSSSLHNTSFQLHCDCGLPSPNTNVFVSFRASNAICFLSSVYVCVYKCPRATVYMWGSSDNFWGSVLAFYLLETSLSLVICCCRH